MASKTSKSEQGEPVIRMAELGAHMPLRGDVQAPPGLRRVGDIRALAVDYQRVAETMERIQPTLRAWAGL